MKKENKFKITKSQLAQIIKEEYASMSKDNARAGEIKARLARINKELGGLPQTLSEVEASGTKKVSATGWTGAGKNDVKYGEKFEKIGSHLKEEDELDVDMDVDMDSEEEGGYFEMKFAELGRDIDGKIDGGGIEDEIEVELDDELDDEMDVDMDSEEEEIETIEMDVDGEDGEDEEEEEVEEINEDLSEPIEGETPAQDSDARFNDYMDKDNHVNEGAKYGTGLLSEGFTPAKKTALSAELERMRNLAKIGR